MIKLYRHDWDNGTATMIVPHAETGEVFIEDRSVRLASGKTRQQLTVAEALDLADEHERFALTLRAAAYQASS